MCRVLFYFYMFELFVSIVLMLSMFFVCVQHVHSATVWLIDVFEIVCRNWWSSMAQKRKRSGFASQTVLSGRMLSPVVWGISRDFLTVMQRTLKMIVSRFINKPALPADPWCDSSFETKAFVRALQLYRQDKGCYESWEMLLGTKEKVSKHTHTYTHTHSLLLLIHLLMTLCLCA